MIKINRLISSGDVDGFFGLAVDNLIQFLLILALCTSVLGFDAELVIGKIFPGAALSILAGNIFYAYQAIKLGQKENRADVTALPYGINTVSLFAFVFLVMLPVKITAASKGLSPQDASLAAWQTGLAACFLSGVIELAGSFAGDKIRRITPRAALLSTLAGIAISFISIDFAVRTFQMPLVALLPLGVILVTYFARLKLPFNFPGGLAAVILGSLAAWILSFCEGCSSPVSSSMILPGLKSAGFYLPVPVIGDLVHGLTSSFTMQFLVPVILPMGLFNVLGSLQNIESAEAAGDSYAVKPSLIVNGAGSIAASLFGSVFPTTIYIGHPGWKALGAKSGYSILNGIFFIIVALFGLTGIISAIIPIEAGMAIVLWIGIIITAQAFQSVKKEHAPAVAIGLFPAIGAFGVLILTQTLGAASIASQNMNLATTVLASKSAFEISGIHLDGLVALSQGFMLISIIWSAASVMLIEKELKKAALWMAAGALLSFFGFIHAGTLSPAGGTYTIGFAAGTDFAIGYLLCALFFLSASKLKNGSETNPTSPLSR